jgi:hypothetical protein
MSNQSLSLQIDANDDNYYINYIPSNVAYGYKKYLFEDKYLNLSNHNDDFTKVMPECIIFTISPNFNITSIDSLKSIVSNMTLIFKVNSTILLKIPLQLLWNLKMPKIIGHKLYLSLPFEIFFGEINMFQIIQNDITFRLVPITDVEDSCITNYNLLCKTFLAHNSVINYYRDLSDNVIQQISSVSVSVNFNDPLETSNEFRIRTTIFSGFIKGFFIETEQIDELYEIQFFINNFVRINYDIYLIQEKCVKISENMIYIPFNNECLYNSKSFISYIGSLNIDRIDYSFLNLKFLTQKQNVKVYALNMNVYSNTNNNLTLRHNYSINHLIEDFNFHSLMPIEDLMQLFNYFNLSSTLSISNRTNMPIHVNGPIYDASLNDIPYISNVLYRTVHDNERNMCHITQNPIQINERYMLCKQCQNCYNAIAIMEWLKNSHENNRSTTCPSCRQIWQDYNVYINSEIIEGEITIIS